MFLSTGDKHSCAGCGACADICPEDCIRMEADEDGFLYPRIDMDRCAACGRCESVCPMAHVPGPAEPLEEPELIAAKVKDESLLMKSASGGAFTEIVRSVMRKGDCYVWGAAYDEDLKVRHICSHNDEQLSRIRGSKYVQSDTGGYTFG